MADPSIDPEFPQDPLSDGADFWRHKSLDELIAEQGVQPINDFQGFLDEIGDVWPEEESVDEFLAWLAETRRKG